MDAQWLKAQFAHHPDKTKAGLAQALGLEASAVSKILSGSRQIKAPEYVIMRQFFGLPSDGGSSSKTSQAYVLGSLGKQAQFEESTDPAQSQWVIPADIIKKHTDTPSEQIKSFQVSDNMMTPDFNKDEHVLVDLSDHNPSPPGTFIISDGFGFLLRHCEFVPHSDPPEITISATKKTFEPQKLSEGKFEIIGRVIAKLQWL